jgi:hypothetical protein
MTYKDSPAHRAGDAYTFGTFEGGRSRFVSGVFDDIAAAERAVSVFESRGYPREQITVIMSDATRKTYLGDETAPRTIEKHTKAPEGAATGGAVGGTLGAIAGAVAAAGTSLLIPGLGLVIAGPLAGALAGLGAGAATGGLVGTLVGAGIPEHEAKYYEKRLKEGDVLVGVAARSEQEADTIEDELEDLGAEKVKQSKS